MHANPAKANIFLHHCIIVSRGKYLFAANRWIFFCPSGRGSDSLFFPQIGVKYTK